jgi:hypothetical protein
MSNATARTLRASESMADLELLWPGGARRLSRRPGRSPSLLILPTRRSPRLLVPSATPGAASMLARHSTSRRQRLAQRVLASSVSTGLLPLLPVWRLVPDDSRPDAVAIEDHVRAHIPHAVGVGVLLGPPRANAKPVLRVFDRSGKTIAFGKVGHTALSVALVRRETEVLLDLARRPFVDIVSPTVLHAGQWQGLEVLLMTALAASQAGAPSWDLPLAAMYELAERDRTDPKPVGGSDYLADLSTRVAELPADRSLTVMFDRVAQHTAATELGFGRWHGDWAPWNMGAPNMGAAAGPLPVWDWERSRAGVPLGFDIVHFVLQRELGRGSDAPATAAALLGVAGDALGRWYATSEQRQATVLLYLTEIVARYAADAGQSPTPALRHRLRTIAAVYSVIIGHQKESHVDA